MVNIEIKYCSSVALLEFNINTVMTLSLAIFIIFSELSTCKLNIVVIFLTVLFSDIKVIKRYITINVQILLTRYYLLLLL